MLAILLSLLSRLLKMLRDHADGLDHWYTYGCRGGLSTRKLSSLMPRIFLQFSGSL